MGSADFNNPVDGGQVDGVRAIQRVRKYAETNFICNGFDKNHHAKKTTINDVPTNLAVLNQKNFDKLFEKSRLNTL
jgi:penicillin-binding protein 1C